MVGWHHQFNGHEFEQTPGDGEGQEGVLRSMALQRVAKSWTQISDWITTTIISIIWIKTKLKLSPVKGNLYVLSHPKVKAKYKYLFSFHILYIVPMRKENPHSLITHWDHTIWLKWELKIISVIFPNKVLISTKCYFNHLIDSLNKYILGHLLCSGLWANAQLANWGVKRILKTSCSYNLLCSKKKAPQSHP